MGKLRKIVHSTFAKLSMTLCVAVLLFGTVGTNILNMTDYSSQTVEAADGDLNNQFTTANGWVRTYPPTITAQESASTPTTAARIRIDVPANGTSDAYTLTVNTLSRNKGDSITDRPFFNNDVKVMNPNNLSLAGVSLVPYNSIWYSSNDQDPLVSSTRNTGSVYYFADSSGKFYGLGAAKKTTDNSDYQFKYYYNAGDGTNLKLAKVFNADPIGNKQLQISEVVTIKKSGRIQHDVTYRNIGTESFTKSYFGVNLNVQLKVNTDNGGLNIVPMNNFPVYADGAGGAYITTKGLNFQNYNSINAGTATDEHSKPDTSLPKIPTITLYAVPGINTKVYAAPAIVSVATTQKSSYPSDSSSNTHASYKPSIVGDTPVAKDLILESAWTTTKDSAIAFEYNNQTDLAPQQAITFSFAEQVYQGTEALVSGRVDIPNNTTQKVTSEVVQAITGGPNVTVTVPDLPNYTHVKKTIQAHVVNGKIVAVDGAVGGADYVTYVPITTSATVKFYDDTSKTDLPASTAKVLSGIPETVPTTDNTVAIPAGYKLATTSSLDSKLTSSGNTLTYVGALKSDNTDDVTVHLVHDTKVLPFDSSAATLKEYSVTEALRKNFIRNITYKYEDDKTKDVFPAVQQVATIGRSVTVDLVTKLPVLTNAYTDWELKSGSLPQVTVPEKIGYTADKTTIASIPSTTKADITNLNTNGVSDVTVYYKEIPLKLDLPITGSNTKILAIDLTSIASLFAISYFMNRRKKKNDVSVEELKKSK